MDVYAPVVESEIIGMDIPFERIIPTTRHETTSMDIPATLDTPPEPVVGSPSLDDEVVGQPLPPLSEVL